MITHSAIQHQLYDYFAGTLPPQEAERIRKHLASCTACALELGRLRTNPPAGWVGGEPNAERSEDFWATFATRVEERIHRAGESKRTQRFAVWDAIFSSVFHHRRIALSGAGVLAVLGAVMFFVRPAAPPPTIPITHPLEIRSDEEVSAERMSRYLRKSKNLLVGISNFKPVESGVVDLSTERRVSQELVLQTRSLRDGAMDHRTVNLLNDLERILVKVANSGDETDMPVVEVIRGGIREENLLFKVRMAESVQDSLRVRFASTVPR